MTHRSRCGHSGRSLPPLSSPLPLSLQRAPFKPSVSCAGSLIGPLFFPLPPVPGSAILLIPFLEASPPARCAFKRRMFCLVRDLLKSQNSPPHLPPCPRQFHTTFITVIFSFSFFSFTNGRVSFLIKCVPWTLKNIPEHSFSLLAFYSFPRLGQYSGGFPQCPGNTLCDEYSCPTATFFCSFPCILPLTHKGDFSP